MSEEAEKCHDELMRKADTIPQAIEIIDKHLQAYADEVKQDFLDSVSDDDILKGAIQQDSMKEQIAWGEGAKWVKEKLHNLKQYRNE